MKKPRHEQTWHESGTDVQVVQGASDAPPVADAWYALSGRVFSTTGHALQDTVPIMCPGYKEVRNHG